MILWLYDDKYNQPTNQKAMSSPRNTGYYKFTVTTSNEGNSPFTRVQEFTDTLNKQGDYGGLSKYISGDTYTTISGKGDIDILYDALQKTTCIVNMWYLKVDLLFYNFTTNVAGFWGFDGRSSMGNYFEMDTSHTSHTTNETYLTMKDDTDPLKAELGQYMRLLQKVDLIN